MFHLHVSCFIFILKHETQQWWGVGVILFLVQPCSSLHKHNNNKKGNTTNAQEGEKEQQTRGREEGVLIVHLKGTKTKPDDGGVSIPCHSFLHNATQEGTHMQHKKVQRTRNQANNERTKTKTISLVGGNVLPCSSLHKHNNTKGNTDNT